MPGRVTRRIVLASAVAAAGALAGCSGFLDDSPSVTVANETPVERTVAVRVVAVQTDEAVFSATETIPADEFARYSDALPSGLDGDLRVTVTVDSTAETTENVAASTGLAGVQVTVFEPDNVSVGAVVE